MAGYENLGPGVSQNPQAVSPGGGNFSADERSYDSLVFQQNCPPMDWEMNLSQSVGNTGLRNALSNLVASSFISGDFLESVGPGSSYSYLPAIAGNENKFILNACNIIVNGWSIRFEYSGTDVPGTNLIELPPPPVASGSRQDLVILEVWKALLSPLPSVDNKSPSGSILRYGNAKAADGPPLTSVNLSDDLIDPSYAAETARRVQIQYRYRVVPVSNLLVYPDGLGDPTITASTVPYLSGSPVDGNALPGYVYSAAPNDPGLWVAGNGDSISATDIGSVDGYIYAIPICMVYRRNGNAFSKTGNVNGGSYISSGTSDRPDGLFSDQIIDGDIIDLRRTVSYSSKELSDNAINSLLTNTLTTQFEINPVGCGGNTATMKDVAGVSGHIGNPDNVRMNYSNKSISQPVAVQIAVPLATTTVTLDLTTPVDLPWVSGVNILSLAPAGTELSAITKIFIDTGINVYDAQDSTGLYFVDNIDYSITGTEIDTATITFNAAIPACVLYLEVVINYPPNNGLSRNVTSFNQVWVPNSLPLWADSASFSSTSDVDRLSNTIFAVVPFNREFITAYLSNSISTSIRCHYTNGVISSIMIPDMVNILNLGGGYVVSTIESNAGVTVVTFTPAAPVATLIPVTYTAFRGTPEVGAAPYDSVDIFYQSRSIQSIPVPAGMVSNQFTKRTEPSRVILMTSASGNSLINAEALNEIDCSSQIAIPRTPSVSYSDSMFFGNREIETNLDLDKSGLFYVPITNIGLPPPGNLVISSTGGVTQDADFRNFWPISNYKLIKTPPLLSGLSVHRKIISEFIVELNSDYGPYGRKGSLFLAVAIGYQYANNSNTLVLDSTSTDAISLFRLRGNPLYYRRTS